MQIISVSVVRKHLRYKVNVNILCSSVIARELSDGVTAVRSDTMAIPTTAQQVKSTGRMSWLFTPVLASLMQNRWSALALVGIAALQVVLVGLGLDGWHCPIKAVLGVPCPGCGLSVAIVALLQGEWHAALSSHAFAPVFLFGFVLMAVVSLLPGRVHRMVVRWIAALECRTGVVTLVLLALVVYWGFRLFGLM